MRAKGLCRVLAIMACENGVVYSLGEGNYVGDEVPPEEIQYAMRVTLPKGKKIPKIELDNGDVVWGCECWWAEVDKVLGHFAGAEWVDVKIADYRKEFYEKS